MENQEQLKSVFIRYIRNECSPDEVKWLIDHFETGKDENELRAMIRAALQEPVSDLSSQPEMRPVFNRIFNKINVSIQKKEELAAVSFLRQNKRWAAVAAVVLITLSAALFHYIPSNQQVTPVALTNKVKNDIAPGGSKAILTLADGRTIVLEDAADGTLTNEAHTAIIKTKEGQLVYDASVQPKQLTEDNTVPTYNTVTTPRGGEYMIILPDGSKVWLNAASSIRFPTAFVGKYRKVELSGEAYFEVVKKVGGGRMEDEKLPFIVTSGNQEVIVLGTRFNIMAYKDETAIKTTLLEGSVEISNLNVSASLKAGRVKLKPGEQASSGADNIIKVYDVDANEAIAWKNGYFQFRRDNIKDIMRKFSRWYDIEVIYDGNMPKDEFVGKIRRSVTLTQALKMFSFSEIKFKIDGQKVIVKQ